MKWRDDVNGPLPIQFISFQSLGLLCNGTNPTEIVSKFVTYYSNSFGRKSIPHLTQFQSNSRAIPEQFQSNSRAIPEQYILKKCIYSFYSDSAQVLGWIWRILSAVSVRFHRSLGRGWNFEGGSSATAEAIWKVLNRSSRGSHSRPFQCSFSADLELDPNWFFD